MITQEDKKEMQEFKKFFNEIYDGVLIIDNSRFKNHGLDYQESFSLISDELFHHTYDEIDKIEKVNYVYCLELQQNFIKYKLNKKLNEKLAIKEVKAKIAKI